MANKIVIDTLISLFSNEIKNNITYNDSEIIVSLKDGSYAKISVK